LAAASAVSPPPAVPPRPHGAGITGGELAVGAVFDDLQWRLDMKYWQAKIGWRLSTPMRQSNSV